MLNRIVRVAATAAHKILVAGWFFRRPRTFGAHAIALTPQGKVVMVKLWYAPGWRLPGGGRDADEAATDAALRELEEEIGMTSYGAVILACELEQAVDFKRDLAALVIVRDVQYRRKRWDWEVESLCEAGLDDLPPDTSVHTVRWIERVRDLI